MNNIMEYVLCRDDIFYFIEKYLCLELRPYQIHQLMQYQSTENVLNIAFRGSGMTTINAVYALWRAMFYPKITIGLFFPTSIIRDDFEATFDELYCTMENQWLEEQARNQQISKTHNKFTFNNETRIFLLIGKIKEIRGISFDDVIVDEALSYCDKTDIYELNIRSKKIILTNTGIPSEKNILEDIDYKKIVIPWFCHDLSLNWYNSKLNSLGNDVFDLEYNCARGNNNELRI